MDVFITRSASYLPFAPVTNDEIEDVLGMVGGKPSRARSLVLRSNGIESRHYALDRTTGAIAMSNAQLTAHAIRALGDVEKIDVLATGTSTPDQLMPGHAVMVHGELGWSNLEAISFAGICLSGTAALKHAWLAIKSGEAQRAIATGSELVSPLLRAEHFDAERNSRVEQLKRHPELAFEKDFLRWMLSDGAGALLLESEPRTNAVSLRIAWIELSSAAHALPACMICGADWNAAGVLQGWMHFSPDARNARSVFAIRQNVRLLNENIVRATLDAAANIADKRRVRVEEIDWFLPHMSSFYFADHIERALNEAGLAIPRERWFTNLKTKGNTGAASPYVMLDELLKSGKVKSGQKLLMFIPESGRFSSGFVMLEAV